MGTIEQPKFYPKEHKQTILNLNLLKTLSLVSWYFKVKYSQNNNLTVTMYT